MIRGYSITDDWKGYDGPPCKLRLSPTHGSHDEFDVRGPSYPVLHHFAQWLEQREMKFKASQSQSNSTC
jgi:hypothetical protein